MASIKLKFRPSTVADLEGTIYFQIIHNRKPRQLLTEYRVMPCEWDERRSTILIFPDSKRKALLLSIRERIQLDIERLSRIIKKYDVAELEYSADDVIREFNRHSIEYSLFSFFNNIIEKLKQNGKIRTSETYRSTLNSFRAFRNDKDMLLDCISSEIMEAYEAWLHNRGVAPNTISFYNRILRAVYNRAVEDEIIVDRKPFRHVYTGINKTVKRALPLIVLKKIKNLDLSLNSGLCFARDMFIMSFYLRGMSFIDMAYLKKSDLKNGYVTYRRHKTGQKLIIKWTKEMQLLLDKYPENNSNRNAAYRINYRLKIIAAMVGVTIPLTLYVARHSWASAAKAKGIPVSVISEGMGHDSETTTQIYLASLDTSIVDKANSLIIKAL